MSAQVYFIEELKTRFKQRFSQEGLKIWNDLDGTREAE